MPVRTLWILLAPFSIALPGYSAHAEEPNSASDPNVLAEFKIDVKRLGCILLPVDFDGEKHLFLLDTGATFSLFDISLRSKLGRPKMKTRMTTLGKPVTVDKFDAPQAFLGPLNLKEADSVGCLDLTLFSRGIGREISGVVGMSFLRNYVIKIDFDNERLLFLRPVKQAKRDWGIELPITFGRRGTRLVKANILGTVDTYLTIDTGAQDSGSLVKAVADYIILLKSVKTVDSERLAASGVMKTRDLRIDSLSLGPFEYKGLVFSEANVSSLGLQFFSRHTVVFDFPNNRLYLKKGKDFNRPDESAMAGVAIQRVDGQYIVERIYQGRPAQKAGMQVGDVIVEIMGKLADSYEMWQIRQLLRSGDKRKIEMTIKRGDEKKTLTVVLRRRI
ncbi:MAG: aspartyl protease family protein [Planctomycetota bacterium]|jgi:predicted aspartyl protease